MDEAVGISIQKVNIATIGGNIKLFSYFKLAPEWVTFSKPVKLEFDLSKHDNIHLALAQLIDNRYLRLQNYSFDETSRILTAEVSHFSDWLIIEKANLLLEKN